MCCIIGHLMHRFFTKTEQSCPSVKEGAVEEGAPQNTRVDSKAKGQQRQMPSNCMICGPLCRLLGTTTTPVPRMVPRDRMRSERSGAAENEVQAEIVQGRARPIPRPQMAGNEVIEERRFSVRRPSQYHENEQRRYSHRRPSKYPELDLRRFSLLRNSQIPESKQNNRRPTEVSGNEQKRFSLQTPSRCIEDYMRRFSLRKPEKIPENELNLRKPVQIADNEQRRSSLKAPSHFNENEEKFSPRRSAKLAENEQQKLSPRRLSEWTENEEQNNHFSPRRPSHCNENEMQRSSLSRPSQISENDLQMFNRRRASQFTENQMHRFSLRRPSQFTDPVFESLLKADSGSRTKTPATGLASQTVGEQRSHLSLEGSLTDIFFTRSKKGTAENMKAIILSGLVNHEPKKVRR